MRNRLPSSFFNKITMAGAALSACTFALILFLFLVEVVAPERSSPYMGLITYLVLPMFFILGAFIALVGVIREIMRRRRHPGEVAPVEVRKHTHGKTFVLGALLGSTVLLSCGLLSYKVYDYTESVEFCGQVCHKVMNPEYVAYKNSPHARVPCVECHIGTGAGWFVRSKVSGSYQVYSVLFNKYHRPIETPIRNLRPARDTCEKCHWPRYFVGEKLRRLNYYLPDEKNTHYRLDLLVKTGGGATDHGPSGGIHWHMNIANQVTYAALDPQRNTIPWIKVKSNGGKVRIYRSTDVAVSEEQLRKAEKRPMDCIDCHNRPTHIYRHPAPAVNMAISQGLISPTLPSVRDIAVTALDKQYKSNSDAMKGIKRSIEDFYREDHPDVYSARKADIAKTIDRVKHIYRRNYFPSMKVSWKAYPNNIGHMYSLGCFRCHDDKHVSDDGKVLSRKCDECHTMLAQKLGDGKLEQSAVGLEFRHPVDVGNAWKTLNCSECHAEQLK